MVNWLVVSTFFAFVNVRAVRYTSSNKFSSVQEQTQAAGRLCHSVIALRAEEVLQKAITAGNRIFLVPRHSMAPMTTAHHASIQLGDHQL